MAIRSGKLRERCVLPLEAGVEPLFLLRGGEAKGAHWAVVVPKGQAEAALKELADAAKESRPAVLDAGVACYNHETRGINFFLVALCKFVKGTFSWNAAVSFEEPDLARDFKVNCRVLNGSVAEREVTVKGVIFRQNGQEKFRGNLTQYFGISGGTISADGLQYSVTDKAGQVLSGPVVAFLTDNEMRTFGHVAVVEVGGSAGRPPLLLEAIGDIIPLVEKLEESAGS
jgi:hypothetical protein